MSFFLIQSKSFLKFQIIRLFFVSYKLFFLRVLIMKEESSKAILHSICQQTGKDGTDANEKDWDAEMTRVKEKEWFARHPQYKSILKLCGIDRLMDTMISLLAQKMITEIPILVREMRERKAEVGYENNDVFLFIWRKDAPGRRITLLPEPP